LAEEARKALVEGDIVTVGCLMSQNHRLLQQITVSGEVNDELVGIALNKLTNKMKVGQTEGKVYPEKLQDLSFSLSIGVEQFISRWNFLDRIWKITSERALWNQIEKLC